MDQQNPFSPDRDVYETGSTKPPKSRGGLVAVLLIAVIFLGGIVSILGILNIKMFYQLRQEQPYEDGMNFFAPATVETQDATQEQTQSFTENQSHPGDGVLDLNEAPQGTENTAQEGGLSYQQIYEKNIPSAVSISCDTGTGSGVVLTANGYIVTNYHVIQEASTITVQLTDGRRLEASVVGADGASDLAVLYVNAQDLTPADFGDSSTLRVGDAVAAIGDPLGLELRGTMTDGIVSAINRDVSVNGKTMTLIQTNAALNSGNSGGALINCYGQVIGINTMKIGAFSDSAGVEGLGFAIPSTTVKEVVDQLIAQGYVSGRPSLGMTVQTLSYLDQQWYRLPAGVLVTAVEEKGAAQAAGLQIGDVLMRVDGQSVTDAETLESLLYSHEAGDTLEIILYRSGKQYKTELTLGENKG